MHDLTARRANAEATDAIRLQAALQRKRCRHCGQSGTAWVVTSTQGEVRYLKCCGCGRNDQIVVPRTAGSDIAVEGPAPQEVA